METFGERLCKALTIRHMSAAELSRKIDVDEGTISNYKKNKYVPKQRRLDKISEALNVSVAWLLGADVEFDRKVKSIIPIDKVKKIPLLGAIACGEPILAEENIEEYILLPDKLSADFALRCKGDSMINARIKDGDIVYIHQQPTVDNGEIAAVLIDDEATLKRVFIYKNKIVLQAENPKYEPFVYIKEEMQEVKILGKAVGFTSLI